MTSSAFFAAFVPRTTVDFGSVFEDEAQRIRYNFAPRYQYKYKFVCLDPSTQVDQYKVSGGLFQEK